MQNSMITFRSVTPAQRAQALLRRENISCRIQRTPRYLESQGCGYGLYLPAGSAVEAVELLRSAGIDYRKVYLQLGDGKLEELHL